MKKLDTNEYNICRKQGKLFEESIQKAGVSSPVFIRRFMNSEIAESFDNKSILASTIQFDDIFNSINAEFGESSYGKIKYSKDEMNWIGYIYRVMGFYYNKTSKYIYKLFPAKEMVKYYKIGHTYDPEDAAERLMEQKCKLEDYIEKGVHILKRLELREELIKLINKKIKVYIDRPIGFNHEGIIYEQNYGYIKELIALDGEYQDAYVIGVNKPLKVFNGKVIAIINRINDNEDKLIVCEEDKDYTLEEIKKYIDFQEKYFKYKIIK